MSSLFFHPHIGTDFLISFCKLQKETKCTSHMPLKKTTKNNNKTITFHFPDMETKQIVLLCLRKILIWVWNGMTVSK